MTTNILALILLFIGLATANPLVHTSAKHKRNSAAFQKSPDLITAQRQNVICSGRCRFRFCNFDTRVFVGMPDVAISSPICFDEEGVNIGSIDETGEALIWAPGARRLPISQYEPEGLEQKFAPKFFKAFAILRAITSGVGHASLQANQHKFIDDICVRLPIRSYQLVGRRGELLSRINTDDRRDCIAFTTEIPRIAIELTWQSSDDLDLFVTEPDGDSIYYRNLRTEGGELLEDTVNNCGTKGLRGRERVVYARDSPVETGVYGVRAQHFRNCGDEQGGTAWRIRVYIDGKLTTVRSGVSTQDNEEIISGSSFTFEIDIPDTDDV